MGAQLRVYKRRIRSVTATKKITKAMEMIAASRVVKAQRKVAASTPYATELTRAVTAVGTGSNTQHPLTTEAEAPTRSAVLLLSSDRGLAGAFNSNAIKAAEKLTARLVAEGKEVDTYIVGRRGLAHYNFRERKVSESWSGFTDEPTYADAKKVAAPLIEAIEKETATGGVDELHIGVTEHAFDERRDSFALHHVGVKHHSGAIISTKRQHSRAHHLRYLVCAQLRTSRILANINGVPCAIG